MDEFKKALLEWRLNPGDLDPQVQVPPTPEGWKELPGFRFLPDKATLRSNLDAVLEGWRPERPIIHKDTRVVALGSCFAGYFIAWLGDHGFNQHGGKSPYDNLLRYAATFESAPVVAQQFRWAFGELEGSKTHWMAPDRTVVAASEDARRSVRDALEGADVLVLTLGLSEVWYDAVTAEPLWRAVQRKEYDPKRHVFRVLSLSETLSTLETIHRVVETHLKHLKVVFTVSPVRLRATFRPVSTLTASSASKAILRAALDEFLRGHPERLNTSYFYFPSFEIVNDIFPDAFQADGRHIHPTVVDCVLDVFASSFTSLPVEAGAEAPGPSGEGEFQRRLEDLEAENQKLQAICDERFRVIEGLDQAAKERLQAMGSLDQLVKELDRRAVNAEQASEARLRVIEEQDKALRALRARSPKEWVRRFVAPRLGVFHQYSPRPVPLRGGGSGRRAGGSLPTLCVVTPSLNQGAFVERTLRSVVEQDYPGIEYVVQDGGSSDGTLDILRAFPEKLRYESGKDGGQANAINRGFSKTHAEVMAYLNADDLFLPGALHYVGRYFARHPEVDVVYGHRIVVDEYDQEIGRWILPPHEDEILTYADYVPQETLFWRRRAWDKVGGLDESFHFAMDWDLILRFQKAGARFVRLPRFLGAFRVHPHQKTSAEMETRGAQEMSRLIERCHGRKLGPAEIHWKVRPYLKRHVVYDKLFKAGLLRY
jgi:glycosyltransferase involved in cell wall biosynthesis